MKKFAVLLILMAAVFSLTAADAAAETAAGEWTEGVVRVGDSLNLRIGPGAKFPVAGKAGNGTVLRVFELQDPWVKVAAPESLTVYVSEVYIRDGKSTRDLNMRRSPDSSSVLIGVLPRGSEVKVISRNSNGWAKIAAPADLRLYASRYYVEFDASKIKTAAVQAETKAEAVGEKPAVKAETKAVEEKVEVKAAETKAVEEKPAVKEEVKAAEKKAEVKKVETKAAEKKAEVKKVETKAAEKKAEVKKAEVKKTVKKASPAENKSLLAEIAKLGMDKKAKPAKFNKSGILIKVATSNSRVTDYALIAEEKNCGFLAFPVKDMVNDEMIGKSVNVRGTSYAISGWKAGVVVVQEIGVR